MRDRHGAGRDRGSGDIRNVYAQNCQMDSPHLDRVLRLKTNAMRGGVMEHVYMRNVQAGQPGEASSSSISAATTCPITGWGSVSRAPGRRS